MENRTTPEKIANLKVNEVFVFGSNLSGRHGKGAAKTALGWGAKYGQGNGIQGRTYGIPTKDQTVTKTLSLEQIKPYVEQFIDWAEYHSGNIFLVTEIGCGLAGYKPKDVAFLFARAKNIDNIHLPERFWRLLNK